MFLQNLSTFVTIHPSELTPHGAYKVAPLKLVETMVNKKEKDNVFLIKCTQ